MPCVMLVWMCVFGSMLWSWWLWLSPLTSKSSSYSRCLHISFYIWSDYITKFYFIRINCIFPETLKILILSCSYGSYGDSMSMNKMTGWPMSLCERAIKCSRLSRLEAMIKCRMRRRHLEMIHHFFLIFCFFLFSGIQREFNCWNPPHQTT